MTRSGRELVDDMRRQVQRITEQQARNAELLAGMDAAADRLAALTATVTSPDGTVTVTAGAGGIVRRVDLAEGATRQGAATLAERINATIRDAVAEATRRQIEIVRDTVSGEVTPEQFLGPQQKFAEYGMREAATPPPRSTVAPTEEHTDEPFGSIYRR